MSSDTKAYSATNQSDAACYLGFANLPNQVHRKSVKKGFDFTLMVLGEAGLGKSTLINSLFYSQLYKDKKIPSVEDTLECTVNISSKTVDIEERGVKLRLTVVDTPGYGDAIDNSNSFNPIVDFIDEQYERFLQHESGLNRRHITDNRIHCCFYFISPIGFGLKPMDIQMMKLIHQKVNIIPLIARADALNKQEMAEMKKRILKDIEANGINIYIPEGDIDEDEDYKEQIRQIKAAIPFAVCASIESQEVRGRKIQGRQYPWGFIETENPEHSDFVKLRSLLVTHMQDLREVTQDVHYENYRSQRLASKMSFENSSLSYDTVSEAGSESEKDRILQEKEAEIRKMQEMLAKMQEKIKQRDKENVENVNGN